jgi:hypothetical protein
MEPDKLVTFPGYIKRMRNQEFYDMEPWVSVEYQNEILNGSFKADAPIIEKFSGKDYLHIEINGYDCYITKSRYVILQDNELEKNFSNVVRFSDIVIDKQTGDILKFKFAGHLRAMLPKVLNIVDGK